MPQFLEKRYNSTCRYVFAVALVVGYVGAILGGTLYAGGLALQGMLNMNLTWAIIFFGVTTGAYTIYGGLTSAAWTDFLQVGLLLTAGILIPILGLHRIGGLDGADARAPAEVPGLPAADARAVSRSPACSPGFLTVGIWYSCTSQHMVQRVLGAKDEWHARMGVVGAGYLRIITPFFFVLPGIIAFKMFPNLHAPGHGLPGAGEGADPDRPARADPRRDGGGADEQRVVGAEQRVDARHDGPVQEVSRESARSAQARRRGDPSGHWLPVRRRASLRTCAEARSDSREVTSERELVTFGRWSGVVILVVSMLIAYYYSLQGESLYVQLQRIFFFIAPPFAVIFLVGLLWWRATAKAAVWTIVLGFAFTAFLVFYAFRHIPWLAAVQDVPAPRPAVVVLLHGRDDRRVAADQAAAAGEDRRHHLEPGGTRKLPLELRQRYTGFRDYRIWWLGFVLSILAIYGFFLWWRFRYPASPTSVW